MMMYQQKYLFSGKKVSTNKVKRQSPSMNSQKQLERTQQWKNIITARHSSFGTGRAEERVRLMYLYCVHTRRLKYRGLFVSLTVCMKQCSLSSCAYSTPSLMKTEMALSMKDTNRFMWMKFLVQCSFLCRTHGSRIQSSTSLSIDQPSS